jgi:putative ABC transport system substrate-binding protein
MMNKMRHIITMCFIFIVIIPCAVFAEGKDGNIEILMINSDASVGKYTAAGDAFKATVQHTVFEINLSDSKDMAEYAKMLLKHNTYNLIYCIGTKAYMVAHKHARKTDIIFSSTINWMRLPVTRKTYGVSNELHTAAQLMLFCFIFPEVKKLGILYSNRFNRQWLKRCRVEGEKIGIEIIGRKISEGEYLTADFRELLSQVDGFWMISDPVLISGQDRLTKILNLCDQEKVPVFSYSDAFIQYGTVLTVSVDIPTIGRQAAGMAEDLMSGKRIKPKVQFPAGSHITLNLRKVKAYGLKYSEDALGFVNNLIE